MKSMKREFIVTLTTVFIIASLTAVVAAQGTATVLTGAELTRVIPPGFYFQGLSAPTQMRNAVAAKFGTKRFVIAGMVDTSGYAVDVRARYEGFFITDSPVSINGSDLGVGAYGFGFSEDGKMHILDLGNNEILSVATTKDNELKRPRPLMITKDGSVLRFYSGRDYVTISPR